MNRREAFRTIGGGAALGALAAGGVAVSCQLAPASVNDPLLDLIKEYQVWWSAADSAETDEQADAIVQGEPMGRLFGEIANNPPSPTTIAGAAAAVRLVRDECNGSYNPDLIRNVLTVVAEALEGGIS